MADNLTFDQAVAHIGGMDNLISAEGRDLIDLNRKDYMWKYPGHAFCTYCGEDVGDVKARHNAEVGCPNCHRAVTFKHESRGHSRIFDQFCLYEWRKSVTDPEAVVLTAAHVWRNSTNDRPEGEPLNIHPSAIYVFRPGKAVTVYKNHHWYAPPLLCEAEAAAARGWHPEDAPRLVAPAVGSGATAINRDEAQHWERIRNVAPDHTAYDGGKMEIVMDYGGFVHAIEGTRIGRLFALLNGSSNRRDTLELQAIASCARRPWLEYLAKAGQGRLAADMMRRHSIPRDIVANQRAKSPRALLGLTEAQWHEVRRDGIRLTEGMLKSMYHLRAMGLGNLHMAEVLEIMGRSKHTTAYNLSVIAPSQRRERLHNDTLGDILISERVPEKTRRKIYRKAINDLSHATEWRDYFAQLHRLGEDFTDSALILPKDMHAMHQRMIERENAIRAEARAMAEQKRNAEANAQARVFIEKRLKKLQREYGFRAHGLVMRPYESVGEVVAEGRTLHICIGSYAERYMSGGTVICCLRREEEPDVPFRAVEFSAATGKLVQDRGEHNDIYGIEPGTQKQLRLFWAAWERRGA